MDIEAVHEGDALDISGDEDHLEDAVEEDEACLQTYLDSGDCWAIALAHPEAEGGAQAGAGEDTRSGAREGRARTLSSVSEVDNYGWIFACLPEEEALHRLYKEPHAQQVVRKDLTSEKVEIHEERCLLDAVAGRELPHGLWFGGDKFTIMTSRQEAFGGCDARLILAVRAQMGVCIIAPQNHPIVLGVYDESQNQCAQGCMKVVASYVADMIDWRG